MASAMELEECGGYDFELDGSKVEEYYCLICFLLLRETTELPCNHTMCKSCLVNWGKQDVIHNGVLKCPKCKRKYDKDKLQQSKPLDRIIKDSLKVKCKKHEESCEWVGSISEFFEIHSKRCKFIEIKCSYVGCNETILRMELDTHKDICPHRTDCKFCWNEFSPNVLNEHYDSCPLSPVSCSNPGCEEIIKRNQVTVHVENDCRYRQVTCGFLSIGCEVKIKPAELEHHFDQYNHQHMKLMFVEMDKMKAGFQAMEIQHASEITDLKEKLASKEQQSDKYTTEISNLKSRLSKVEAADYSKQTAMEEAKKELSNLKLELSNTKRELIGEFQSILASQTQTTREANSISPKQPLSNDVKLRKPTSINISYQSEKIELTRCKNPWIRPNVLMKSLSKKQQGIYVFERNVRSILNKLTPQKFKTLIDQMTGFKINTVYKLEKLADIVLETAITTPKYSVTYANLSRVLTEAFKTIPRNKNQNFRRSLLNKCQKEIGEELNDKETEEDGNKTEDERERDGKSDLDNKDMLHRKRRIGCLRFLGELFKLKMISEKIMHELIIIILKLLRTNKPESMEINLECLCELLATIGKDLDHQDAKPRMDQYFQEIHKIIEKRKISSRIKFALKDVMDLRASAWVPRRDEWNPKTIDQIHEEIHREARFKGKGDDVNNTRKLKELGLVAITTGAKNKEMACLFDRGESESETDSDSNSVESSSSGSY